MSEYDDQKAKLNFSSEIDYYDSTDFAQLSAEVDNDGWIGTGDAMATLALLREDGTAEQVYLPVQVDNGPATRGAKVHFAVENVSRQVHGEVQISLIDLSGAEAGGSSEWKVFYGPIRDPFQ